LCSYRVPGRGLTYTQRSKLVKYSPKLVKGKFLGVSPLASVNC
jgi:hypothetical protein